LPNECLRGFSPCYAAHADHSDNIEVEKPAAFLDVQLFEKIAIAFASDFLSPGTPRANEMEATHPLV
jgi:hypothetical protein